VNGELPRPDPSALKPIPTYRGVPPTQPHDVVGFDESGRPRRIDVVGTRRWTMLLFLSSHCDGCRPFWSAPRAFWDAAVGGDVEVSIVTKGPEHEDRGTLPAGAADIGLVMSTPAWTDYRVSGPPFFVLVDGANERVATEGVAWGLEATADFARRARRGDTGEPDMITLTPPSDGAR
jgi:hypothetical protein